MRDQFCIIEGLIAHMTCYDEKWQIDIKWLTTVACQTLVLSMATIRVSHIACHFYCYDKVRYK